MSLDWHTSDLGADYPKLLEIIHQLGDPLPSRVGMTREIIAARITLNDPLFCIVDRDKFSSQFLDLESAMILGGHYDEETIRRVTPRAADLVSPETAYGPRVVDQLINVANELHVNPESRRAVVYVGRHTDFLNTTNPAFKGEMPCTMTWQFLRRNNRLTMIVNMRSWDAVWGLCYDIPCFVLIQMAMARDLKIGLGSYIHNAGSLHIYVDRDKDVQARSTPGVYFRPRFSLGDTIFDSQEAAAAFVVREGRRLERADK